MRWLRSALRRVPTLLMLGLITGIILPVGSEYFIELAKERGLYDEPSQRLIDASAVLATAMAALAEITSSWWFAFGFGVVVGARVILWLDQFLRKEPEIRFGRLNKRRLVAKLREYEHPSNNIRILVGNKPHIALGEALAKAFKTAGWSVNFDPIPREPVTHKIWNYVVIGGYNRTLCSAVHSALNSAGVPHVRVGSLAENRIKRTSPNWARLERRTWIQIGHHRDT